MGALPLPTSIFAHLISPHNGQPENTTPDPSIATNHSIINQNRMNTSKAHAAHAPISIEMKMNKKKK